MGAQTTAAGLSEHEAVRPRIHWHVALTHFPVSAFPATFLFMAAHVVTDDRCYARASYLILVAGVAMLVPASFTGWRRWRSHYHSYGGSPFRWKIRLAIGMLVFGTALATLETISPLHTADNVDYLRHVAYFAGVATLMVGATLQGYLGGRLHHHR